MIVMRLHGGQQIEFFPCHAVQEAPVLLVIFVDFEATRSDIFFRQGILRGSQTPSGLVSTDPTRCSSFKADAPVYPLKRAT